MLTRSLKLIDHSMYSWVRLSLDDESVKKSCPRLCNSQSEPLQQSWCTEVCYWQTAAGNERRCSPRQRNAQVWPRTVAAATCRLALARCGRSSPVQAPHHGQPVSAQQSAKVPDRLLCRCLGYRWSSETALSTPSPAGCSALSTNNARPSGVFCRWTNHLELFSRRAQRWDWEHFPAVTEKTAFQTLLVSLVYTTMRYINRRFTDWLTYLLIYTNGWEVTSSSLDIKIADSYIMQLFDLHFSYATMILLW